MAETNTRARLKQDAGKAKRQASAPEKTKTSKAHPPKAAPAKAAALKAAPVKADPVKPAPVKAAAVKASPAKPAPVKVHAPAPTPPKPAAPKQPVAATPVAPPAPVAVQLEAANPTVIAPKSPPSGLGAHLHDIAPAGMPDFEKLAANATRMVEYGQKALAAAMEPLQKGEAPSQMPTEVGDAVRTLGKVAEYWLSDPFRAMQAQTALNTKFVEIWGNAFRRMTGEDLAPVIPHDPRDKRFSDPQWRESPLFDFLRQTYAMTIDWAQDLVARDKDIDELTRSKAGFYVRQIAAAFSPTNFIGTNPELLRTTFREEGDNLVRGLQMLAEDIEAGKGSLRLRQSDSSKFILGVNMAVTPGKVVFRNELIELIQYAPQTDEVYKRPLLIIPPWINKFYILDLNEEKSFIRWAVSQGLTVFVVSWINPLEPHADMGFKEYMYNGLFAALENIEKATGEKQVTAIGYCVGGTLLATALAFMAAKGDDRINSATFFTTQVDFTDPGDLKVFTDAEMIKGVEEQMKDKGYLDGSRMANAFNMLRPNDLIWSYVVNNYMKGQQPMAFDLLTWNSDATRMTRANHSFYLREYYLSNNLAKGELVLDGVKLDLGKIKIPVYDLASKEDHIAPARSAYNGAKLFGGDVRYVMAGSGHIAGVVNPPGPKPKYQHWTGDKPKVPFEDWVKAATETPGSWWPDWIKWIAAQAPEKVPAREPGGGKLTPLCDAPGEYVRAKC